MKDRLVSDCIQILRVLLDGETSVNDIVKKTGLYKSHVFDAIPTLQEENLIEETQTKTHKQKKIKRLLPTAVLLAELRKYTEHFNISYSKLMKAIKENFENGRTSDNLIKDSVLKARLSNKKWTLEEISHYHDWAPMCKAFGIESGYKFLVALCARYVSLQFEIGNKEFSRLILSKIFTDTVNQRGSYEYSLEQPKVLDDREFPITMLTLNQEIDMQALFQIQRPVINYIDKYTTDEEPRKYLNNRFVKREAKEVINSISCIIGPPSKRNIPGSLFYLKPELKFNGW